MNNFKQLALATALVGCFAAMPVMAGEMKKDDAMMMKSEKMMPSDAMMKKDDGMMAEQSHQIKYSAEEFAKAEQSGKPFFVAFHKKWCAVCAAQNIALKYVYQDPAAKDLKVLVVDYDNDTDSLKKFNVGQQSELILYKGDKEISRTNGLVKSADILNQAKI